MPLHPTADRGAGWRDEGSGGSATAELGCQAESAWRRKMAEEPYTRAEVETAGREWPDRGPLCPHCGLRIPQFAELSEVDERRVRELIREFRWIMAIAELEAATGCPLHWAQLWVEHAGRPKPDLKRSAPCPFCGMPLRTSLARQCRHCRRDWHDPELVQWLGEAMERA